ncbi:MAG TPA: SMI1/KNR4 family protein [Pseudonocardia sp.]|jgi:hypothetical protein|nr:SMI1/KNR4 family protein [Pseudonocardia sp.]
MDLSTDASDAVRRLPAICDALAAQGMEPGLLIMEPPASASEVAAMEERIGFRLPESFRRVVTSVSQRVDFDWFSPDGYDFQEPFDNIFRGSLSWSLAWLPDLLAYHQGAIDVVFPDPDDPYDVVWHNKFPIMSVGNGDYLAIDPEGESAGRVVYLSNGQSDCHGFTMASSFEDLLVRWIPLGCPGGEDWQWKLFYSADAGGIDPTSEIAQEWIQLMNLDRGRRSTT